MIKIIQLKLRKKTLMFAENKKAHSHKLIS